MPETVRTDVLPAPQVNGVVWKQAIAGNTVYAGGEFTKARPFGVALGGPGEIDATDLIAYDITTGALITDFHPTFDGVIRDVAVTPDQTKLVVVGTFTHVNGQVRNRVAVFDLPTRTLNTTIKPDVNSSVDGVAVTDTRIWIGGNFGSVSGVARNRVASILISTGTVNKLSMNVAGGRVQSIVVKSDGSQIVFSGHFTSVDGSSAPGYGLYRANAVTGAKLPLPVNNVVRNAGANSSIDSLAADDTSFYGAGYNFKVGGVGGNTEGVFQASWSTGGLVTMDDCHGDSYGIAPIGDIVYVASHHHVCTNSGGFPQTQPDWTTWHATAWTKAPGGTNLADTWGYPDHPGTPHGTLLPFFPQFQSGTFTGQNQATWTVTGNADYVLYAGEFTKVDGVAQQGIVRFGTRAKAPNKMAPSTQDHVGPTSSGGTYTARAISVTPGEVQVSWPAAWDRDDLDLTYKVYRDVPLANLTSATPVNTQELDTNWWWTGSQLKWKDTDPAVASGTHFYYVVATDPDGNKLTSGKATVTVASSSLLDPYSTKVLDDGATKYWRLDGQVANPGVDDLAGPDFTTAGSGVTFGAAGAMSPDVNTDNAATFDGTANGVVVSKNLVTPPDTFSEEVWFKTSSTTGGQIAGLGDSPSASPSKHYDRTLSLDSAGNLRFGVAPGGKAYSVKVTRKLNDDQWHQAVATLGPDGMVLYVDGNKVGSLASQTAGIAGGGYWRLGGDHTYFNGSIDEFAVYPTALTADQVKQHWIASGHAATDPTPPTAAISSSARGRRVTFKGIGASTDGATISSYAWDYGDGITRTATTPSVVHTYKKPGTYTVTLTVTDDRGLTSTAATKTLKVVNAKPIASFTATVRKRTVSFHGTRSSDPDGRIVIYSWHFGDGKTARGSSVRHTYSKVKTYSVTLIVVDDSGARSSVTHKIKTKRR